jgi:hypothetical protein
MAAVAGIGTALVVVGVAAAAVWLTDSGTVNVRVDDRTGAVVDEETAQGAFVSYFGDKNQTFGSSGTGTFSPFVRLQNDGNEAGYNTDGALEFNTKSGMWTHSILVSRIPQRPCPEQNPPPAVGSLTCFELFVDINENNSTPFISLNKLEVYFADSASVTGYDGFGGHATPAYKFSGNVQIKDVNQGSGRGDLRYDIPINGSNPITLPTNCDFGNPACNTYFVLYSLWGTGGNAPTGTYQSDGGFEEWKVKVYPALRLTKTANPTDVCNGGSASVTYTYVVQNTGTVAISGPVVDDNGTPANAADDVTVGTFSNLAAGASQTFTHVFTVSGTRTNVATATGTAGAVSTTATATATVTGRTCAITLSKTPSVTNVCSGGNTSVTYTYVVSNTGFFSASGTLVDDNGTPGNTADDINVGSWGPIAPGASQTLTNARAISATTTNTATASGTSNGTSVSATASATVTARTCSIGLTKTPSVNTVCTGGNTSVTYTYVVTNTGDFFSASGTLVDDNGTPANAADDISVGSWGPLAAGASQTLTNARTINATTTNTATASGTSGGKSVSATAQATVTAQDCAQARIAPTETTCAAYRDNPDLPANNLSELQYTKTGSLIANVTPGVFFYYMKVTVGAGSHSYTLTQSSPDMPGVTFDIAAGSAVFNSSCVKVADINQQAANGSVTITFTGAGTFIIAVKFDSKSIQGETAPSPSATFTFQLTGVANSTDTLNLVPKP